MGPGTAPDLRTAYNERHRAGLLRDRDRFYRWIARRMAPPPGAAILDVGCGGGFLLAALGGGVGLEISDVALRVARRVAPASPLVLGQGERLPFPERSFDVVACLGNLEHFLDPGAGAREIARVLRPEGAAWILLPNSFYSGSIWRVIRTGYGPDHHQPIDRFGTVNEWRDLLEGNGLRVTSVIPYDRFKWWKRLLPKALAWHFLFRCVRKNGACPRHSTLSRAEPASQEVDS